MPFSHKVRLFILTLVLVCAAGCDQTSKHLARIKLGNLGSVELPGGFGELRLAENSGSFLSLGDSLPEPLRVALFTVGAGVGLLGLLVYLAVSTRLSRHSFIGLALIWAGGTSNLFDRVTRRGLVTDFVFIRFGPLHTGIFNLADVLVMIGLTAVVWDQWNRRWTSVPQPPAKATG